MRLCSVEGCEKKHRRNGYCDHHSARVRRHGDPHKLNYFWKKESDEERKAAIKASQRRYDKTPKGKAAHVLKRHRRRQRQGGMEVKLSTTEVLFILDHFSHKCFACETPRDLTLDHHIPIACGGSLNLTNTVILCRRCNGLKSDKTPEEFYSSEQMLALSNLLSSLASKVSVSGG